MSKFLIAYNSASGGSVNLVEKMGIKRIKRQGSKFQPSRDKTIINWGCSEFPMNLAPCRIINSAEAVMVASDKLKSFKRFSEVGGVPIVPWTTSREEVRNWLNAGKTVIARTILRGHSGNGIQIMDPEHEDTHNVVASLYTQYVPKKEEYRIHVCKNREGIPSVIDVQKKLLREEHRGNPHVNWKVRNLANGFIYARADINPPEDVLRAASEALRASGLDFGAVDVIWNDKNRQAYVLEINNYARALGAI
jgi:glutathione synthase/RimK-type ligase-like ATP-grasp enzyme